MTGEKIDFEQTASDRQAVDQKRERSTIQFPYGDLEDAEYIAGAIHANAGDKCTTDQLAAYVKQSATSGTFRLRLSTTSTFGLTENQRGEVVLTDLGRRILDPAQQRKARAEAFMHVPLYQAIYNKYKGFMLPPAKALEREIANLGVSTKQTGRARQAFERSAQRAGFAEHGNDRLVMPAGLETQTKTMEIEKTEKEKKENGSGNGGCGGDLDPFIQGLLKRLPQADDSWPMQKRVEWLQAAEQIFKLIYKGGDDGTITIQYVGSTRTTDTSRADA